MTKRQISVPASADDSHQSFIEEVDSRLRSDENNCDVVEDVLVDLHGDRAAYERYQAGDSVSPAERVRLEGYDPRNATLESEYYAEVADQEQQFRQSKCLQWLWRQFDATPMADNVSFALRFRQMLADHLFAEAGDNLRLFKGITFTYGHNITVGDNVVIHDGVHLDDRGKLTIGDRVSISDDVHIYTHEHDVVDQTDVTNYHTIIEDDVRLTYDSMVQAGVRLGENSLLAAKSVANSDVPDHHVAAGQPAEPVTIKDGWESISDSLEEPRDRREKRVRKHTLPDIEVFDEFQRDLSPPGCETSSATHR